MKDTSKRSLVSLGGILGLFAILILVNALGDSALGRLSVDLTEEGLFSLSEGSEAIIEDIEEPITLKLYLSKTEGARVPAIKMYGSRVRDLLETYVSQSKGKIKLEVYDPRPDSEEEEWAQKYGLIPIPLTTGYQIYFGLVAINESGEEEILPVFNMQRQEYLEFDISKAIYSLSTSEKPLVGVMSSLNIKPKVDMPSPQNMRQELPQPWILVDQLKKFASVVRIDTSVEEIPASVDVLLVAHAKQLPESALYAIDQYVVKGGNAIFAVDPYSAADEPPNSDPRNPMASMGYDRSSAIDKPLSAWGVRLDGKQVLGDINLAAKVSRGPGAAPLNFPVWLSVGERSGTDGDVINRDSIITSELENIVLPWAGSLELNEVEGIEQTVLIKTSSEAMLYDENTIRFSAQSPDALLNKYIAGFEEKIVAVQLSGMFPSAFSARPDSLSKLGTSDTSPVDGGHLNRGSEKANVLVISDVDFLSDRFSAVAQNIFGHRIVRLLNDNLIFAANAIENLSGSDSLISLRSRGKFTRPFTRVQEIEADAEAKYKEEEQRLQAKLQAANQRLSQLQAGAGAEEGKAVFNEAMLAEIQKFRDERQLVQKNLRELRRKLREEKEWLGSFLFALNSFFIPVFLIVISLVLYFTKSERRAK